MDTLGKYKTNFLGNKNSFNIGFNNRSPFSYKSSMPTNFISVPTISASPGDYSLSTVNLTMLLLIVVVNNLLKV